MAKLLGEEFELKVTSIIDKQINGTTTHRSWRDSQGKESARSDITGQSFLVKNSSSKLHQS